MIGNPRPDLPLVLIGVDAVVLASLANDAPTRLVATGSAASGLLLLVTIASAVWALAAVFVPGDAIVRASATLLGAAFVIVAASTVADQLQRLEVGTAIVAVIAIAVVAGVPIAVSWAATALGFGTGIRRVFEGRSTSVAHYAFDAMGRPTTTVPPVPVGSATPLNTSETSATQAVGSPRPVPSRRHPRARGATATRTQTPTYDALGGAITMTTTDNGTTVSALGQTSTYNIDGTLATLSRGGDTITFDYDDSGRQLSTLPGRKCPDGCGVRPQRHRPAED